MRSKFGWGVILIAGLFSQVASAGWVVDSLSLLRLDPGPWQMSPQPILLQYVRGDVDNDGDIDVTVAGIMAESATDPMSPSSHGPIVYDETTGIISAIVIPQHYFAVVAGFTLDENTGDLIPAEIFMYFEHGQLVVAEIVVDGRDVDDF